jgi:hypothetical protein
MKRGNLDTVNLSKNDSKSNIINYKKKIFISILLFTLTLNIFALPVLASNDVAYIFKNKRIIDENIIEVFEGLGLDVELINEKNIPSDLSNYKFVYLGDERYRNEDEIKIWKYPAIISNYFYGDDWGLTDRDGISKLASSSPLSIKIGNKITQVYNQAKFNNGVSIPYYYLGEENKVDNLETIAQTYTGNGNDIGDVISYGNAGLELENGEVAEDNICFFGIIESNYWTEDVVELLEECVGHVSIICENNNDCEDIDLGEPYCIGKNVAQDTKEPQCENPGTIQSACVGDIITNIVKVCTSNCQDGECICFDNDNDGYDDCNIGEEGDDGKTLDCNDNDNAIHPNAYEICDNKDNNCNNQVDENDGNCGIGNACSLGSCVEIECNVESDCGLDGFFDGRFCDGGSNKDIYQNYIDFTCENPGTISSSCTQEVEAKLITECSDTCSAGSCISIGCNTNNDCQDNNDYTFDECLNAGTLNSYCSHEPIECLNNLDCNDNDDYTLDICSNMGESDSYCSYEEILCLEDFDCGIDGFVNGLSCNENNVVQDYRSYDCENPGTLSSSCTQTIESLIVNECSDTCNTGNCITITCNNDNECEDGNDETTDICLNPGTIDSMCTHEDVLCSNNNDCGTNRYTGELFCNDKKILRNFASFSCNSAGTDASFCSNSIDAIEVYECAYACNEGSCLRCNTQDDCNDGNENTIDVCRFGGSIDSYCSHDVISCFQDNDCGLDSFVGTPFCLENNVYQNFRDLSCTNAGTSGSFCDAETNAELIDTCLAGEICLTDQCVNDCIDNDNDGYDNCSGGLDDDGKDLDCNDNEFNINPGALEVCDGIDNNCDGNIDEGTDLDLCGPDNTCTNSQCIPICTPPPNIFNFAYTQDRIFLQDSNVIDWNNNICYDEFYESNGNTYCSGLALKYYDSGASATQLCNMKGYSTATITDSGTWSSCHDNTIAYYSNGVWKTQNGCTGGNRHINSIQCTNPLNDCL